LSKSSSGTDKVLKSGAPKQPTTLPSTQNIMENSSSTKLPTLTSPGVTGMTVSEKRKISLRYLAEISNFSGEDVRRK